LIGTIGEVLVCHAARVDSEAEAPPKQKKTIPLCSGYSNIFWVLFPSDGDGSHLKLPYGKESTMAVPYKLFTSRYIRYEYSLSGL